MEKKFIINRVDLGQRVTGYEVFNPAVNGGEVIGIEVPADYRPVLGDLLVGLGRVLRPADEPPAKLHPVLERG